MPWTPQDDVLLVRAAQTGDPGSFDILYRRHVRIVHAVLMGRATRDDVEDLVQEVFLTAWRQLATLRDPAAFGGWVVTIARHLRIDHGRRQRPQQSLESSPEPQADADAVHRLEAHRALAAIRELPAAYRDTLMLRHDGTGDCQPDRTRPRLGARQPLPRHEAAAAGAHQPAARTG